MNDRHDRALARISADLRDLAKKVDDARETVNPQARNEELCACLGEATILVREMTFVVQEVRAGLDAELRSTGGPNDAPDFSSNDIDYDYDD